jgi:nitric oxide reductase NorE protein
MELTAGIQKTRIDYKSLMSPPGGLLIWILILLEVFTFGLSLVGLMYYRVQEPVLFAESSAMLNTTLGGINTIVLLTSGFFMAAAVHSFKEQKISTGTKFTLATIVTGLAFLVIKWQEYGDKLEKGLGLDENMFFTFYWLLTGFHFIHVLVGLVILTLLLVQIRNRQKVTKLEDIEAGAAFWHMCDLIWLLLFPALYLVF